jgi:hypothetical protein
MPTDDHQPLSDQLADLDGQIATAEAQMRETAPLSEYRRLIELLNGLRAQRNEIQTRLDAGE